MKSSLRMKTAAAALVMAIAVPMARPAPVGADKSPLAWVPATAPIVIHINGLETVRDHYVAFLKNAVPEWADLVNKAFGEYYFKEGIDGRKLKGLAKDGPIFVVFTEMPRQGGKPPEMAFLVAVASYPDFRDNLLKEKERQALKTVDGYESTVLEGFDQEIFFVDQGDYAVVTPSKDVAMAFTQKRLTDRLAGKMSKAQARKFLASDVGVYVNMGTVNKEFEGQITSARASVDELLKKANKADNKSMKLAQALAKPLVGFLFQAVKDSQGTLVTLEVRPAGVALHAQMEFHSGSKTAALLKDSKQAAFNDLAKLPTGQFVYVGMAISPSLTNALGPLLHGLTADPDSRGAKDLNEAFEEWVSARPTEEVASSAMPLAGLKFMRCADPEKAVKAAVKMLESQAVEGGYLSAYLTEKPRVNVNAQKFKDIEFTSIHMAWDFEKMIPAGPPVGKETSETARKQMIESMKKLMGVGMDSWIGTDGKVVIAVNAKDWEAAQDLLDKYFKGEQRVGDDKVFVTARKELPAEATFVEMIDAMQYAGFMLDLIKPMLESSGAKLPVKLPAPVKGEPGYLGFAGTLMADRASIDLVVTAESVKQIYKNYVVPMLHKDDRQ